MSLEALGAAGIVYVQTTNLESVSEILKFGMPWEMVGLVEAMTFQWYWGVPLTSLNMAYLLYNIGFLRYFTRVWWRTRFTRQIGRFFDRDSDTEWQDNTYQIWSI